MANNKEEAGKGTPRPGDVPGGKRTYATIDLSASEVESKDRSPRAAASAASATSPAEGGSQSKADGQSAEPQSKGESSSSIGAGEPDKAAGAPDTLVTRALASSWLPHLASGALGAVVVLIVSQLTATDRPLAPTQEIRELTRRMADIEGALGTRPGAGLRARIEEMSRSIGALGETQAKLARESRALEGKVGSGPELRLSWRAG